MARQPAQIASVARLTGDRLVGATNNEALQLAGALADVAPEARNFAARIADEERTKAAAQARADALRTSGAAFADAVQQGLIEKTQNPWYMTAYRREAAQVSATTQLAALQEQSQTWEERNDAALFNDRLNREIGVLGEAYQGPDEKIGFLAAANQTQQAVAAANTSRNVARINQERDANSGQLVAQAIASANMENGGNATPAQLAAALVPLRESYVGTGGSALDWDSIVVNGFKSAAYAQSDTDLLNVLKSDDLGNLYSRPDVAGNIESDQYRIRQGYVDRLQFDEQARRAQAVDEGGRVRTAAFETYGDKLLTGDFSPTEFIQWGTAQGYSLPGISEAIRQIQSGVADTQGLVRARQVAFSQDPQNARRLLDLAIEGETRGYSAGYADKVGDLIMSGQVSVDDARSMIGNAFSRSRQLESEGRADAREARADARAQQQADPQYIENYADLSQRTQDAAAAGLYILQQTRGTAPTTQQEARMNSISERAARTHLAQNPGDFQGALVASRNAVAAEAQRMGARRLQTTTGGANQSGGSALRQRR